MLPTNLSPEAIQFITVLRAELERQNVTQELDEAILELLAMNYHTYNQARLNILERGVVYETKTGLGSVIIKSNPAYKVMVDSQIQLMRCLTELGCSPRSRKQLKAMLIPDDGTVSPLQTFISKAKEYRNA